MGSLTTIQTYASFLTKLAYILCFSDFLDYMHLHMVYS